MPVRNSPERYRAIPKTFHWFTVVLVIAGWLLGHFIDDLPKALHPAGLVTHIAIGTTIFLLLIMRLSWRFFDPSPLPKKTALGLIAEIGAQSAHYALYALLVVIPILGVLLQFARGNALPIFELFEIPSPWLRPRVGGFAARNSRVARQRVDCHREPAWRRRAHAPFRPRRSHAAANVAGRDRLIEFLNHDRHPKSRVALTLIREVIA
jgi:cytochrome b561